MKPIYTMCGYISGLCSIFKPVFQVHIILMTVASYKILKSHSVCLLTFSKLFRLFCIHWTCIYILESACWDVDWDLTALTALRRLALDICSYSAKDSWEPLCSFLGLFLAASFLLPCLINPHSLSSLKLWSLLSAQHNCLISHCLHDCLERLPGEK